MTGREILPSELHESHPYPRDIERTNAGLAKSSISFSEETDYWMQTHAEQLHIHAHEVRQRSPQDLQKSTAANSEKITQDFESWYPGLYLDD